MVSACAPPVVLHGVAGQRSVHGRAEGPDARPGHADAGRQSGGHRGRTAAHPISQPAGDQSPGEIRPDQHHQVG